jgi:hypothetical protein
MTDQNRFYPEEMHRRNLLVAYYQVLNNQPGFCAQLQHLTLRLHPFMGKEPLLWSSQLHPFVQLEVRAFMHRWALPQTDPVMLDIAECIISVNPEDPPELWTYVGASYRVPDDRIILPNVPLPFEYDPMAMPRSELTKRMKRISAELEESIRKQAEEIEERFKARDFRPIPPQYKQMKPDELLRLALRLFRRAVLHWPYAKIADTENEETDRYEKTGHVAQSGDVGETVKYWAEQLGIDLPDIPRGRPKSQKNNI